MRFSAFTAAPRSTGATQVEPWDSASLHQAAVDHLEAKQSIGRSVARPIPVGAHVALSGGSTTLAVARALKALHFQGEVVTNALDIAVELAAIPGLHVVCTRVGSTTALSHLGRHGNGARALKLHFFDFAVIGVSGVDLRHGFTVNSQVEAATVNLIADHVWTVVVAVDSTKFGRVAFASVLSDSDASLVGV